MGEVVKRLAVIVQCNKYHCWILKIGQNGNPRIPTVRLTEEQPVAGGSGLQTQTPLLCSTRRVTPIFYGAGNTILDFPGRSCPTEVVLSYRQIQ